MDAPCNMWTVSKAIFFNYLFIWLHWVLFASCRIFSCDMQTLSCNKWDLVPWPGTEPGRLHWEHGVLAMDYQGSPCKLINWDKSTWLQFIVSTAKAIPSPYLAEKAMAPHSSTLAWKIPWIEEPGRLQSMGSLSIGHDWATSLSLFTFMHWRRKWQPTPVFLPWESQGRGILVGWHLWGRTESDTTEAT